MREIAQLVKKDQKDKIRVIEITLTGDEELCVIERKSGMLGGKMIIQPDIYISAGKSTRTVVEQAELEFRSMLSDYLDKGYKHVSSYGIKSPDDITYEIEAQIINAPTTDTLGNQKHQLAKLIKLNKFDVKKPYLASRKLRGVRCTMSYDQKTGKLQTSSRGGKHFDYSTQHLLQDKVLLTALKTFPDIKLDGELYIHGRSEEYIAGLAKTVYFNPDIHEKLEFHVYDIMIDEIFIDRLHKLINFFSYVDSLCLLLEDFTINEYLFLEEHEEIFSNDDIVEFHERSVFEGYEGAILRDPQMTYGYGARDIRMLKVKEFDDDEFEIVGKSDGLRPEDVVFKLKTKEGKLFEAKPTGSRSIREAYSINIDRYIGMYGKVKYQGYSDNGVPKIPVFLYVRETL